MTDDLVQEAAMKALAACDSFLAGTNFGAWIRRILLNSFITGMRSRRFIADVEVPDQAIVPDHIDGIALCELALAMDLLPREQKAALFPPLWMRDPMPNWRRNQGAQSAHSRAESTAPGLSCVRILVGADA